MNLITLKLPKQVTPSTLLIPLNLLPYFESQSRYWGSRNKYFKHLIETYARYLTYYDIRPRPVKWKKEYQEEGLDLQIKSFKPTPIYWEEFRNISLGVGMGMCKLFVVLLELEYQRWKEAGFPEKFCEQPVYQPEFKKQSRNSIFKIFKKEEFNVKNLIKNSNCTILVRKIDFSNQILECRSIIQQT